MSSLYEATQKGQEEKLVAQIQKHTTEVIGTQVMLALKESLPQMLKDVLPPLINQSVMASIPEAIEKCLPAAIDASLPIAIDARLPTAIDACLPIAIERILTPEYVTKAMQPMIKTIVASEIKIQVAGTVVQTTTDTHTSHTTPATSSTQRYISTH